jgi:hypothetical protein
MDSNLWLNHGEHSSGSHWNIQRLSSNTYNNVNLYCQTISSPPSTLYLRQYIKVNSSSIPTTSGDFYQVCGFASDAGGNYGISEIIVYNSSGTLYWGLRYRSSGGFVNSISTSQVTTGWNCIELKHVQSTGTNTDGEEHLYLNGVAIRDVTGVSNNDRTLAKAVIGGSQTITNPSDAWSYYVDDFVVANAYLGPLASKLAYTAGSTQSVTLGSVSSVITVQVQDSNGTPVTTGATVGLSTTSSGGHFYSDSAGNTQITSRVISSGQSSGNCYYKDTTAGNPTLTASSTGLTSTTTNAVTITSSGQITATAPLHFEGNQISITTASGSTDGYLAYSDFNAFSSKQNALTTGDLTGTTNQITVSGGTGAIIGSGTTISLPENITTENLTVKNTLTLIDPQNQTGIPIHIQNNNTTYFTHMVVDQGAIFKNDVQCYGFFGSVSDPIKGTGGGAVQIGHGFTSPTDDPHIYLNDTITGGSNAEATLTVNGSGHITGVIVTDSGSGYTFADVAVGGSGAILAPELFNNQLRSIAVIRGGHNYRSTDTITINGDGLYATATLAVNNGVITAVNVTNPGSGYTFMDIAINLTNASGDTLGTGARLAPIISNGHITGVTVCAEGTGYSSSDIVTITNDPHDTLYLKKSTNTAGFGLPPTGEWPANLDLGNITAHGNNALTIHGYSQINWNTTSTGDWTDLGSICFNNVADPNQVLSMEFKGTTHEFYNDITEENELLPLIEMNYIDPRLEHGYQGTHEFHPNGDTKIFGDLYYKGTLIPFDSIDDFATLRAIKTRPGKNDRTIYAPDSLRFLQDDKGFFYLGACIGWELSIQQKFLQEIDTLKAEIVQLKSEMTLLKEK